MRRIALLLVLLSLSACGLKGNLFLPEPQQKPAAAQPAPAEPAKEEDQSADKKTGAEFR